MTELLDAIRARAHGRHVVVIRGYPDPDSLASAWAHALLSASIGVECDIAHLPVISRAENRAMVNLLEVPLVRISAPEELDRYAALCLVDTNAIELPKSSGLHCVSIVDHHSVSGKLEADFVDIRTSVGATSTIYTEYLWEVKERALDQAGLLPRIATALAYGIRSDTDDLLRATAADLRAMSYLARIMSTTTCSYPDALPDPCNSDDDPAPRASTPVQIEGTWAFAASAGCASDRDAIGQAAGCSAAARGAQDGDRVRARRRYDRRLAPHQRRGDRSRGVAPGRVRRGPARPPYGGGRRGKGASRSRSARSRCARTRRRCGVSARR